MDKQRLIDDLHISLANIPDAIERLFCGAVLGAGVDNAAKVLKTYNEWKDLLGISTAALALPPATSAQVVTMDFATFSGNCISQFHDGGENDTNQCGYGGAVEHDRPCKQDTCPVFADILSRLSAPAPVDPRLLDMLAVLHRDGGHYVAEHGLDKAIADAKEKYLAAVQSHDAKEPGKVVECGIRGNIPYCPFWKDGNCIEDKVNCALIGRRLHAGQAEKKGE